MEFFRVNFKVSTPPDIYIYLIVVLLVIYTLLGYWFSNKKLLIDQNNESFLFPPFPLFRMTLFSFIWKFS